MIRTTLTRVLERSKSEDSQADRGAGAPSPREAPPDAEDTSRLVGDRSLNPRILLLFLLLPGVGALAGVLLRPAPADRFVAESIVSAPTSDTGSSKALAAQEENWKFMADVVRLPDILSRARDSAAQEDTIAEVAKRVQVAGRPSSGLVRIRGRGTTRAAAATLTDAVVGQALTFTRRVADAPILETEVDTSFSFDQDVEGWGAQRSIFSRPALRIDVTRRESRFGSGSLDVACESRGCGPAVRLARPFVAGTTYTAVAFARSDGPARVRLVLGANERLVTAGAAESLGPRWRQLAVSWTPPRTVAAAELAIQTQSVPATRFQIDGVGVRDADEPVVDLELEAEAATAERRLRTRQAAHARRFMLMSPARDAGVVGADTTEAAILGAAIGLLAALCGLVFSFLARRRPVRGRSG